MARRQKVHGKGPAVRNKHRNQVSSGKLPAISRAYEKPRIRKVDESQEGDFWCD